MKVLILNDVASVVGGAEALTLDLRAELRRRGHDARVLASDAFSQPGESPADYHCRGATGGLRTLNRVANPSAWLALRRALAKFRPDVVHVRMVLTQLSPLVLPLLRGTPSLYHAVWYESICPLGTRVLPDDTVCEHVPGRPCRAEGCLSRRAWIALMAQRRLWEQWRDVFGLVVANSGTVARRLSEHGIGPVRVIWNGVPRRPPRPALAGPPVVGYAGRLTREKGVHVLLRAFARVRASVPEATLLVLGDGPERPALERLAAELGLAGRVRWTGHLARGRMERELDAAWVHAVPSLMEEPFGLTAAEAMMRGTTVVASGHGGPAEIVQDGATGILVPPNDPAALATALTGLLGDRGRCERQGRAGRELALDRLGREAFADRLLEAYTDVIAGRAA